MESRKKAEKFALETEQLVVLGVRSNKQQIDANETKLITTFLFPLKVTLSEKMKKM